MAAYAEVAVYMFHRILQIYYRVRLGRYRFKHTHVEVFFPPHERIVRAAEHGKRILVSGQIGDRGKLLFLFKIEFCLITAYPDGAEAYRVAGVKKKLYRQFVDHDAWIGTALVVFRCTEARSKLRKRHLFAESAAEQTVKIQIGNLAQNKSVRVVERCIGKRQITAPCDIVNKIRHTSLITGNRAKINVMDLFFKKCNNIRVF